LGLGVGRPQIGGYPGSLIIARAGNFGDGANAYTKGHSEEIVGDCANRGDVRRDQRVIASTFTANLFPGDPNAGGFSRKALTAACDESLRRLQTDYIDLYWMHAWDRFTPIEETMCTLDDLVHAGKVRYLGFSDTPAWKVTQAQLLAHFRGWTPLIALQIEYSLVERTVESELPPIAQTLGLGVTPWLPFAGGVLTGKYTRENVGQAQPGGGRVMTAYLNEWTFAIVDELTRIGRELNTTPAVVVGAVEGGSRVHDHRREGARAAGSEPRCPGCATRSRRRRGPGKALGTFTRFSEPVSFTGPELHAHGGDGQRRCVSAEPMAPQNDSERY
jgi:aryl-alcohol dehydrogenase-like predicted oxidoreductase